MNGLIDARRLAWPFAALDFESSGLVKLSYPIEAAICVWPSPEAPATTWSSLIDPDRTWRRNGVWQDAAQAVHRIPLRALSQGLTPAQVMGSLNDMAPIAGAVHCDGGSWDHYWMGRLADAALTPASFHLTGIGAILKAAPEEAGDAYLAAKGETAAHRAAPDAEAIIAGMAAACGLSRPDFVRTGP